MSDRMDAPDFLEFHLHVEPGYIDHCKRQVKDEKGTLIAEVFEPQMGGIARRLVACFEACIGIPTPVLEEHHFVTGEMLKKLKEHRDLTAAINKFAGVLEELAQTVETGGDFSLEVLKSFSGAARKASTDARALVAAVSQPLKVKP